MTLKLVHNAEPSFEELVKRADAIFKGEFYRCAESGKILDSGDPGDDKVVCHCKRAQANGRTHNKRDLKRSTAEAYVRQHEEGRG